MVMVVYDVTSESSFDSCAKWLERVRAKKRDVQLPGTAVAHPTNCLVRQILFKVEQSLPRLFLVRCTPFRCFMHAKLSQLFTFGCIATVCVFCFPGVLLANKIDLDQRRAIDEKTGREFASSNGLEYFECSAVSF